MIRHGSQNNFIYSKSSCITHGLFFFSRVKIILYNENKYLISRRIKL
nr:MAG TPA: hypothetical protein [Caudoviricetes sp.]